MAEVQPVWMVRLENNKWNITRKTENVISYLVSLYIQKSNYTAVRESEDELAINTQKKKQSSSQSKEQLSNNKKVLYEKGSIKSFYTTQM